MKKTYQIISIILILSNTINAIGSSCNVTGDILKNFSDASTQYDTNEKKSKTELCQDAVNYLVNDYSLYCPHQGNKVIDNNVSRKTYACSSYYGDEYYNLLGIPNEKTKKCDTQLLKKGTGNQYNFNEYKYELKKNDDNSFINLIVSHQYSSSGNTYAVTTNYIPKKNSDGKWYSVKIEEIKTYPEVSTYYPNRKYIYQATQQNNGDWISLLIEEWVDESKISYTIKQNNDGSFISLATQQKGGIVEKEFVLKQNDDENWVSILIQLNNSYKQTKNTYSPIKQNGIWDSLLIRAEESNIRRDYIIKEDNLGNKASYLSLYLYFYSDAVIIKKEYVIKQNNDGSFISIEHINYRTTGIKKYNLLKNSNGIWEQNGFETEGGSLAFKENDDGVWTHLFTSKRTIFEVIDQSLQGIILYKLVKNNDGKWISLPIRSCHDRNSPEFARLCNEREIPTQIYKLQQNDDGNWSSFLTNEYEYKSQKSRIYEAKKTEKGTWISLLKEENNNRDKKTIYQEKQNSDGQWVSLPFEVYYYRSEYSTLTLKYTLKQNSDGTWSSFVFQTYTYNTFNNESFLASIYKEKENNDGTWTSILFELYTYDEHNLKDIILIKNFYLIKQNFDGKWVSVLLKTEKYDQYSLELWRKRDYQAVQSTKGIHLGEWFSVLTTEKTLIGSIHTYQYSSSENDDGTWSTVKI